MADTGKAVLSNSAIEDIRYEMNSAAWFLKESFESLDAVIKAFENETIVQTFFVAGNFGEQEKEKLAKIKEIVQKEANNILDNLIPTTKKILEEQESLNNGVTE